MAPGVYAEARAHQRFVAGAVAVVQVVVERTGIAELGQREQRILTGAFEVTRVLAVAVVAHRPVGRQVVDALDGSEHRVAVGQIGVVLGHAVGTTQRGVGAEADVQDRAVTGEIDGVDLGRVAVDLPCPGRVAVFEVDRLVPREVEDVHRVSRVVDLFDRRGHEQLEPEPFAG